MKKEKIKIVDSFLFSEVYEKELLLLKFILENDGIDEWILLENAYSFQGSFTGIHAKNLIWSDERFEPYRNKITIIAKEQPTQMLPKHQYLDELSYKVEFWQRDLAYDYFINNYDDDDWIMISDVDEMIDFTDAEKKKELYKKMTSAPNGLLRVPTKRFWYDFDNEYLLLIGNAMCNKKYLLDTGKMLHHVRLENRKVIKNDWKHIVEFEYSSCYDTAYMLQKFYTSTHTGFTENDLKQSLRCNHRPTREASGQMPQNNKKFFFEKITLTESNSPKHVRENLAFYKTNAINPEYRNNRKLDYPELFKPGYFLHEFYLEKKKWANKKFRFLLRRLNLENFFYGKLS